MSKPRTNLQADEASWPDVSIKIAVEAMPEPGLLRPAIEAALAGRAFPGGPEATIAQAVAHHVEASD
jgi:hypothetical protein